MNILLAGKYFTGSEPLNQNIINFLKKKEIKFLISEDSFDLSFLLKEKINLIINSGYGPIIKNDILKYFKNKIINMHNSYLPNGRGIYPNLWSIFCKYQSGITLCYLDEGIDTGNIILQKKINFNNDNITLKESWDILQNELSNLLIEKWDYIINPKKLYDQNKMEGKKSYHNRKYSEELVKILPNKWKTTHKELKKIAKKYDFSYEKFIFSL